MKANDIISGNALTDGKKRRRYLKKAKKQYSMNKPSIAPPLHSGFQHIMLYLFVQLWYLYTNLPYNASGARESLDGYMYIRTNLSNTQICISSVIVTTHIERNKYETRRFV